MPVSREGRPADNGRLAPDVRARRSPRRGLSCKRRKATRYRHSTLADQRPLSRAKRTRECRRSATTEHAQMLTNGRCHLPLDDTDVEMIYLSVV